MEIILGLLIIAVILYLAFWLLVSVLGCIIVGLVIGIIPAIISSVRIYLRSINDEVTNPAVKWTLNISVGLACLVVATPVVLAILAIIVAIV
ncbi:MAG: hypothetical protein IJW64_00690 [Clostridia bacterium]|nr:hypothetical protein [Clostridia bacterium]